MSPPTGWVGSWFRSRDLEEVGVVLVSIVASIYMGVGLLTQDGARSGTPGKDRQLVVVITGEGPAERLVAKSLGDAVLTLPRSPDPGSLLADVQRLQPTRLVILGGDDVVSADVAADLTEATTASVTRYAGQDRYETAARAALSTFHAPVPEALIAASDASLDTQKAPGLTTQGVPVLLVARGSVPAVTTRALQRLQPQSLTIVDPAGVVSEAVIEELRSHTPGEVTRAPAV